MDFDFFNIQTSCVNRLSHNHKAGQAETDSIVGLVFLRNNDRTNKREFKPDAPSASHCRPCAEGGGLC